MKLNNQAGKGVKRIGTSLASSRRMKRSLSYRDITLIIGLIVAIIVVMTLVFPLGDVTVSLDNSSSEVHNRIVRPQDFLRKVTMLLY